MVQHSNCLASQVNYLVLALLLLSLIWTCSVLSNIVHCMTASTVFAWWRSADYQRSVVHSSFNRAVTVHFGSICLGSLLQAAVTTLQVVFKYLYQGIRRGGKQASGGVGESHTNALRRFVAGTTEQLETFIHYCLISLDKAVAYFNKYAFCFGTCCRRHCSPTVYGGGRDLPCVI